MSPDPTREFLVLLGRIETAVRRGCPQEEGNFDCAEDIEVWRAKVRSFEATLRGRLAGLDVSESNAERYRSRIEELCPALEIALAEQRQAAATTEAEGETANAAIPEPLLKQQQELQHPQVAAAPAEVFASAERPAIARARLEGSAPIPVSVSGCKGSEQANLPWRKHAEGQRASTRDRSAGGHAASRHSIENEMDDIVMQMKNAANSFNRTLKEDISHLEDIDKSQTKGLDKVKAQTDKGKKFMRSNQLSFFCTMIMVAVSVIIFFMMIPFIIFT
eukprot:TRINITY_DN47443_c0_g1_i1.p1 TRINITY_DN47443_c0_g1~~TRINITY_DN47443_c0_g1_i1.p1  ORF type:complete len:276 (-),score=54.74 TRINITY_DN47443_c0_g1_i1:62-889(-)